MMAMMAILGDVKRWIISVVLWLSVKRNREVGLLWTKRSLDLFESMAKLTESKRDDKVVDLLQEKVDLAIKINKNADKAVVEKAASVITKIAKGTLKSVSVTLQDGKPIVKIGGGF